MSTIQLLLYKLEVSEAFVNQLTLFIQEHLGCLIDLECLKDINLRRNSATMCGMSPDHVPIGLSALEAIGFRILFVISVIPSSCGGTLGVQPLVALGLTQHRLFVNLISRYELLDAQAFYLLIDVV